MWFLRQEYWSGLPLPSPACEYKYMCVYIYMYACMLCRFSCLQVFVTSWNVAHQVPLSTGFSRKEYWSGLSSSRGSFWIRDQTHISCGSCIAERLFTAKPSGKPMYVYKLNEKNMPLINFLNFSVYNFLLRIYVQLKKKKKKKKRIYVPVPH